MQLLNVWTVILVWIRICAAGSIPARNPGLLDVGRGLWPFTLTEVDGRVWDCIECNLLCSAAIAACSAVCLLPEPDQPFLCAVRIRLSDCPALAQESIEEHFASILLIH